MDIDAFIEANREEMIESVCALVQIPSVDTKDDSPYPYGRDCAAALDFCRRLARKKGLWTEDYAYYGLEMGLEKKVGSEKGSKRLLFAAHTDVVPASEGNIYPPFGGQVVGDYIVGRGVVDDKAPLVAVIYALAYLKENHIPVQTDVRLFCGSHEETDMKDFLYYLERAGQPDFGLAVDDDFPITNGEKGMLRFALQVEEKAASEEAKAVLEKAAGDLSGAVFGIAVEEETLGCTSCKLLKEEGGQYAFDARIPVCLPMEEAVKRVETFAKAHGLVCEITRAEKGYIISPEEGIPKLLTDLYNTQTNVCQKPYIMQGCTYARHFRRGCGFGAGNPLEVKPFPEGHGSAHGPDEAHHIGVFLHAVKMYIMAVLAIDAYWKE